MWRMQSLLSHFNRLFEAHEILRKKHKRVIDPSSLKKNQLICDICNVKFSSHESLNMHKRVHTGEKSYNCPVCQKSFTQSGTLVRHKRIHSGEKIHQCTQCDKKFNEKKSLVTHKLVHTRERPHSCNSCEKAFSQINSLKCHILSHTGENAPSVENLSLKMVAFKNIKKGSHGRKVKQATNVTMHVLTQVHWENIWKPTME